MAPYGSFYEAWQAKQKKPTPAPVDRTTGTFGENPQWQQQWANAYSGLNPTWTPPADQNAALPNPIQPVRFDPYGDVGYAAGASAVTNANQHAGANHTYQSTNIAQSTGYDAQGNLINDSASPFYNPYSQAAILKKNYDDSVRGTTNSYAGAGQLYSGALTNAQATNDWGYGVGSDQLKRGASNAYHGNDMNLQGTQDAGLAQLAALLGPAFASFLASQGGK